MRFFRQLYYYYFYIIFIVSAFVAWPWARYSLQKPERYPRAQRIRQRWARLVLFLTGYSWEKIETGPIQYNQPYIYCGNHTSNLDILLVLAAIPSYYAFMGKEELLKYPLFRAYFTSLDISVDRSSGEKSAASYRKSIQTLEEGRGLIIFPEGGIFGKAPQLNPFKEGAFDIAVRRGVAVLPFTMPDNWKMMPDETKSARPGKIRIILHSPEMAPEKKKESVAPLANKVFDIIEHDLVTYTGALPSKKKEVAG